MDRQRKSRIVYLDVLRCLACLAVVLLHSSSAYATYPFGTAGFYAGHIFDSLSRFAVPVFVMVSGALMLDESRETGGKKLLNRFVRLGIFYVFWSVAYGVLFKLVIPLLKHQKISVSSLLGALINGHYHLWFIPMILGLYAITPLLRLWVKRENLRYVRYFLLLAFIFAYLIPRILEVAGLFDSRIGSVKLFDNLGFQYVAGYTSYYILGWYLHTVPVKKTGWLVGTGLAGLGVTVFGTMLLSACLGKTYLFYNNLSLHTLAVSVAVFCLVKSRYAGCTGEEPGAFLRAVYFVADNSLGVYAVHAVVLAVARTVLNALGITGFADVLLAFLIAVPVSLAVSWVGKKIPGIRRVF